MSESDKRKSLTGEIFRNSIVDAAEKLFQTHGYDNTKIDDIAKAAELSKKTLYTYISSKEEIYDEIAIRSEQAFYEVLADASKVGDDFSSTLESMVMAAYKLALDKPFYMQVMMTMHIRESAFNIENNLHKTIAELDAKILMLIEDVFRKGIDSGFLQKNIDIKFAIAYVITTFWGIIQMMPKKMYYNTIMDISFEDFVKNIAKTIAKTFKNGK